MIPFSPAVFLAAQVEQRPRHLIGAVGGSPS
jgi:hypothetical protein